jgi:hypothetical protein
MFERKQKFSLTRNKTLVLPLPLLPLLLLRKWDFAASLVCVFVVDGLGFAQLCVGML